MILEGHKRNGKRMIPPLLAIGNFHDVSWLKDVLPEIIWIAIINDKIGWEKTCTLLTDLCKITMEVNNTNNYVLVSSFSKLNEDERKELNKRLKYLGILSHLDYSLCNFLEFYPECPLNFLYNEGKIKDFIDVKFILNYKKVLRSVYNKTSKESTFLLASVVYAMLCTKKFNVPQNSNLTRLEEIKGYPDSDISQQIAGVLRSTSNMLLGTPLGNKDEVWTKYFWNRGLSIEPCRI